MEMPRARWIVLACLVIAASWLYSCSDDDDTTCPVCPQIPGRALIGLWEVFEATMNGSPAPIYLGMEFDFQADDTLWVQTSTDSLAYSWMAGDSMLTIASLGGYDEVLVFHYELEADTLNLEDLLSGMDVEFRLLKK